MSRWFSSFSQLLDLFSFFSTELFLLFSSLLKGNFNLPTYDQDGRRGNEGYTSGSLGKERAKISTRELKWKLYSLESPVCWDVVVLYCNYF